MIKKIVLIAVTAIILIGGFIALNFEKIFYDTVDITNPTEMQLNPGDHFYATKINYEDPNNLLTDEYEIQFVLNVNANSQIVGYNYYFRNLSFISHGEDMTEFENDLDTFSLYLLQNARMPLEDEIQLKVLSYSDLQQIYDGLKIDEEFKIYDKSKN